MPNLRQAPKLYHNKQDYKDKVFYNLPQELMDCVFTQLDGRSGNQIKLMCVLLGTLGDGSFGVSEAWICDRTGMVQQTYSTARRSLVKRGWIYVEDSKIYVLPEIIKNGFKYPEGSTDEQKKKIREDTISHCVNNLKKKYNIQTKTQCDIVSKGQCDIVPQTQCDIVYNKITINKEINNNAGLFASNEAHNPVPEDIHIDGELDQKTVDRILDKQYIAPDIILTTTGRYFKIKNKEVSSNGDNSETKTIC